MHAFERERCICDLGRLLRTDLILLNQARNRHARMSSASSVQPRKQAWFVKVHHHAPRLGRGPPEAACVFVRA